MTGVGVFLVDTKTLDSMAGYICAKALTRSVREEMPGVPVVHLTDVMSPGVDGVDEVIRMPRQPMARLRMLHHASLDGEWLFLDTDVLIQRDVRHVFSYPFDLAVTDRAWPHLKPAAGFTKEMPWNMGVVFSRSRAFWREALDALVELPKEAQRWMGDQEVFCKLIGSRRYAVHTLAGQIYNFPPAVDDNKESRMAEAKAAIVHFKGPQRKPMMLRRLGEHLLCV